MFSNVGQIHHFRVVTPYYPGAVTLHIRMTGDRQTGRLLGAQILGHRKAEISKRIDIVAAALFQNASVEQLNDMDLSYTPPFSSPWDPVQVAAQAWSASQTASGNRGPHQGTGEPLSSTTRASPH